MTKTRSLSIYLLKEGFHAANALKADNGLKADVAGTNLPAVASLFVLDNLPREPWWKSFFGIVAPLQQASKGALVFLPVGDHCFALSFGHVSHNLKDSSYEYDFGLRVTLNCVDPDKLKSTDTLEPSGAKRQRTQLPNVADLTFFDLDTDSAILKSLTGKVKTEHQDLFKHATGSSNIRVSSKAAPDELSDLCAKLLELYLADTYKTAFPGIQNISPVRDPSIINELNANLIEGIHSKDDALFLTVPELQDYENALSCSFAGAKAGKVYEDILIDHYYQYLAGAAVNLDDVDIKELKQHSLLLTDPDGAERNRFSIFKCLIYDTTLNAGAQTFHLCEGNWYLVEADFIKRLSDFLDPHCAATTLPDFVHENEGEYNEATATASPSFLCLDTTSIAPNGQHQLEPCDILELQNDTLILHHIKISTLSAPLSHLFNQGANSFRLLRSNDEAKQKLGALISANVPATEVAAFLAPLEPEKFQVVYGIITPKNANGKSKNLPLFSRISLMRCLKDFQLMGIKAEFAFITDASPPKVGKAKVRKPKANPPA
jgi:uncharacterized protein (TIGR04141 family)